MNIPNGFWVGGDINQDRVVVQVAKKFGVIPLLAPNPDHYGLWFDDTGWSLHAPASLHFSPLRLDFSSGTMGYRLRQAGRRQPLARAIGLSPGSHLQVLDATAGLGRDASVMAQIGCKVTMIERSPVMSFLLQQAWMKSAPQEISSNVSIHCVDAREVFSKSSFHQDVIYLDPMYPHRDKSALVKKEMRIIRDLVGDDADSSELLYAALATGCKRVVVKRPRNAPPIVGPKPLRHIVGPNTRYDIYKALTST